MGVVYILWRSYVQLSMEVMGTRATHRREVASVWESTP